METMKFLLDSEKYRADLAGKLMDKRKQSKEDAKDLLEQEKKTDEYDVARRIKHVNEIRKKTEKELEKIRNIKIEEINIQNLIPTEIKLYVDRRKLNNIDYALRKEGVFKKNIAHDEAKKIKTDEEMIAIINRFINQITDGDFLNNERLNHVIYGYGQEYPNFAGVQNIQLNFKSNRQFFPLPYSSNRPEIPQDRILTEHHRKDRKHGIYFAAGGSKFCDGSNPIIICNPFSKRFMNKVEEIKMPYHNEIMKISKNDKENRNNLLEFITCANEDKESGISIKFFDLYGEYIRWADIADWIVDIPNEKLYRITEVDNLQKKS